MFDRFVRLAEARRALRKGQLERVLRLTLDPLIRDDRRGRDLREQALSALLSRAGRRAEQDAISAALADVALVLEADPQREDADTLANELRGRAGERQTAKTRAGEMMVEARRLLEQGELDAALRQAERANELYPSRAELHGIQLAVGSRRAAALEGIERARSALGAGDAVAARERLREARGQDCSIGADPQLVAGLHDAVEAEVVPELERDLRAGRIDVVLARSAEERRRLPNGDAARRLIDLEERAARAGFQRVRDQLLGGDIEAALQSFDQMGLGRSRAAQADPFSQQLGIVRQAMEDRRQGRLAVAAAALEQIGRELAAPALRRLAKEASAEHEEIDAALVRVRELARAGDLVAARRVLLPLLERWPLHEGLRAELDILDVGTRDVQERLARARELAKDGRLREASAVAVVIASGPAAEEAALLLQDLRTRMDLVTAGLDQVRRAIHGRTSATLEGVRHCLLRLEQLAKVQTDNADLEVLRAALQAEIDGLEKLAAASAEADAGHARKVAALLDDWPALRPRLLAEHRLDARALELADRLAELADRDIAAGRLQAGEQWAAALAAIEGSDPGRRRTLQQRIAERRNQARAAVEEGEHALQRRDLATAITSLERARTACSDGSDVQRLEAMVMRIRRQEAALDEVAELAAADVAAAGRKMDRLPPTPPALRTRVFDLRRSLARKQGLDGGFLLRVDEGGEFLVLRSESILIGNVRDNHADLAVLANIAGRHARISRSMSFHGGMQDQIVAERGEVFVGGEPVTERRLRNGDRVRLGSVLEVLYQVPSTRSLTVLLRLLGGFQVHGTDKVLLLKDRGRDGRILIGNGSDCHVRVPHAQSEVELFANRDGQIRVRFDGDGEINDRPFRGEHPVDACAVVRCGAVSFSLHPRSS